jgi:hypothetical protein
VVEGTRLESVRTGNRTEGSNPSLSAIKALRKGSIPFVPFLCEKIGFLKRICSISYFSFYLTQAKMSFCGFELPFLTFRSLTFRS